MNPAELLTNHTYRMMLLGTVIIGFTTGAIGTFAYLRKRTLLADVVSHSSIGGVMLAFIIAVSVTNGGSDAPLALGLENWDTAAKWLGLGFFAAGVALFARLVLKAGREA